MEFSSDFYVSYRSQFSSVRLHLFKMATKAASGLQMAAARPCISNSRSAFKVGAAVLRGSSKVSSWAKLSSACHVSSIQSFQRSFTSSSVKFDKFLTKAVAEASEKKHVPGLPIDLKG